ncbi:MAG: response regulator [Desulfamplus sp.]|nr:response regulator [Desulfamplus sp.]
MIMSVPKILIVDDEERFCITLQKILRGRDLEVDTAKSGMEALQEIKQKTYDVVVLDVKMPGLSGIETLKEIKKINVGIEVILLTGHASVDSGIDGMRLGAYDYIMKPCDTDTLMDAVNSAYAVKSARDERLRNAEKKKESR